MLLEERAQCVLQFKGCVDVLSIVNIVEWSYMGFWAMLRASDGHCSVRPASGLLP